MKLRECSQPYSADDCWAQRSVYVGQLYGATCVPCSKPHRPGFLTCWAHRYWEREARRLRDRKAQRAKEQAEAVVRAEAFPAFLACGCAVGACDCATETNHD
jgi:hypothetical protein